MVKWLVATRKTVELRLLRKSARQARRKDDIVRVALDLADRRGVDAFTADDVAHALGMSTPSVFYYFPGGLLELRATVAVQRFYARTDPIIAAIAEAKTGVDALKTWVRGLASSYAADVEGFGKDLEIMQRGAWGRELVEQHITKLNELFSLVEKKLEVDRARGRLHPAVENPRRLAMLMNQLSLGLVVGDQLRRKAGGGSKHALDALVEDLCGLLERGTTIAPPKSPRSTRSRRS